MSLHLVFAEYLDHVLVQPFYLVAGGEGKVFGFLTAEERYLGVLVLDPLP